MDFEYDINKSNSNKHKHGISFEEAKALWLFDNVVLPAITIGEHRYMIIGNIGNTYYSCIFNPDFAIGREIQRTMPDFFFLKKFN